MDKEKRKEYNRRYYEKNKEYHKNYNKEHCEEHKEYNKKYYEEHKEEHKKNCKEYSLKNKEAIKEYKQNWYKENREKIINKSIEYYNTPIGRAKYLLNSYNTTDIIKGRGKGDLTPEWIVENIFTKPCAHCGKEGWNVIGCNRLNNSKPHTKDNVEPCCWECNSRLGRQYQIDIR